MGGCYFLDNLRLKEEEEENLKEEDQSQIKLSVIENSITSKLIFRVRAFTCFFYVNQRPFAMNNTPTEGHHHVCRIIHNIISDYSSNHGLVSSES